MPSNKPSATLVASVGSNMGDLESAYMLQLYPSIDYFSHTISHGVESAETRERFHQVRRNLPCNSNKVQVQIFQLVQSFRASVVATQSRISTTSCLATIALALRLLNITPEKALLRQAELRAWPNQPDRHLMALKLSSDHGVLPSAQEVSSNLLFHILPGSRRCW